MIVLAFLLLLIGFYFYTTRRHDYWTKRKIKHDAPVPIFGNHYRNTFGYKSIVEISFELYNKYENEKAVGYFRGSTPELIIRDLDIARTILNLDFACFYARGVGRRNTDREPLLANLFHADGDTWKLLRQRLTPAFTNSKMKSMFPLVVQCAEKLQGAAEGIVARGGNYDVRELMARFTTEFIGACGFGINIDTINDEQSLFRQLGKSIFQKNWKELILVQFWNLFPELDMLFYFNDNKVERIISKIVTNIIKERNNKPSGRNDFIDLLLELEAKGKMKGKSIEKRNADGTPVDIEMEMELKYMVAQVYVFFAAGFETSSSATSYTLHELAFHPDIQIKIQEEIDEVLSRYDNKLSYDAVAEMSLLNSAFEESMRIFPSLGVLQRVCVKRFTIPELNITIDPGVKIIIPIQAIQMDKKYFDNPTEFRPERFTDQSSDRNKYSYLPFGEGPRACIGARLGKMQSLAGLAAILQKFSVEPSKHTKRVLEVNHWSNIVQGVISGLPLKLKHRKFKD